MNKKYFCIDNCGSKVSGKNRRCSSCAKKGTRNVNWSKNGIYKRNYWKCLDCGKIVSKKGNKCKSCARKLRIGVDSPSYKGDKAKYKQITYCKSGCGNIVSNRRKNNCESCAARERMSGDKHWNWQNGKSFEIYPIEFSNPLKEKIRKRDNYICQTCNKNGNKKQLDVHHIDYDKKNNDINNLISLCRNCHVKTNYDRQKWIAYFRDLFIKRGIIK